MRYVQNPPRIEEFYQISGSESLRPSRPLFFSYQQYDAVLFVHDLTDASTRSAISGEWVPDVMQHLGDVGAVHTGARLDGNNLPVSIPAALNELRFLWRHFLRSHTPISPSQTLREGATLLWCLFCLVLHDTGIWIDPRIDQHAERAFLATSLVPVAIIGMKADLVDMDDLSEMDRIQNAIVPTFYLHASTAAHDTRLAAFLNKIADSVKRKSDSHGPTVHRVRPRSTGSQMSLAFP